MGRALFGQGRYRDAVDQLREALRLRPTYVAAHFNLAGALVHEGETAEAVAHYRKALALQPDWTPALIALAWVLSSHPDPAIRLPGEAVALAARAVVLADRGDPSALDALAAAHASGGRFDEAVSAASRAADLAAARGAAPEQVAEIQRRLALYRQGRPYVEGVR
jgi:Flp pilus assembly protein TadD